MAWDGMAGQYPYIHSQILTYFVEQGLLMGPDRLPSDWARVKAADAELFHSISRVAVPAWLPRAPTPFGALRPFPKFYLGTVLQLK